MKIRDDYRKITTGRTGDPSPSMRTRRTASGGQRSPKSNVRTVLPLFPVAFPAGFARVSVFRDFAEEPEAIGNLCSPRVFVLLKFSHFRKTQTRNCESRSFTLLSEFKLYFNSSSILFTEIAIIQTIDNFSLPDIVAQRVDARTTE